MIFDSFLPSHPSLISIFLWPQFCCPHPVPGPATCLRLAQCMVVIWFPRQYFWKKKGFLWRFGWLVAFSSVTPQSPHLPSPCFFPDRYERIGLELWEKFSVDCWGCLVMSLGLWKAKDLGSWWREGKMGDGREEKYRQGEELLKKTRFKLCGPVPWFYGLKGLWSLLASF